VIVPLAPQKKTKKVQRVLQGWYPVAGGRWKKGAAEMLPLYEGKMVQMYDHRAASVVINPENLHRPAIAEPASEDQHSDWTWTPSPQFLVASDEVHEVEPMATLVRRVQGNHGAYQYAVNDSGSTSKIRFW
jgi:hypothetical protein